jgi:hypothetical protein
MNGDSKQASLISLAAGSICFLMGIILLGALTGIIPAEEASFLAPPAIILAIGLGLVVLGFLIWIPKRAPSWIRGLLGMVLLGMLAVICNWSAFAPGVQYSTNLEIGSFSSGSEDPIGGRIVFGLAALALDLFLLGSVFWIVKAAVQRLRQ